MRNSLKLAGSALAVLALATPAAAESLRDALVAAYNTNPTLTAARAQQRATDEGVPLAKASGLPSLSVSGGYTEDLKKSSNSFVSPDRQVAATANLSVPLFSGGAVRNAVRAAQTRVDAGRANLRGTESDVFTQVVGAYMDVIRDEAIVRLNQQNVKVLQTNLEATRDRFQVGDLTRTDVAQSEARLAGAQSQLEGAQAQLIASRETYIRVVGFAPGALDSPPPLPGLPDDPNSAVKVALDSNPQLLAARKAADAAGFDVDAARAARLPKLSAVAGGNYYNYLGSLGAGTGVTVQQSGTSATAGLSVSVPLYQGGRPAAQVRQAQALEGQALEQTVLIERGVVAQARSAYAAWQSSLRVIEAAELAVKANRLSLEGVRAENSVGTRTILDILNAEQELLNSQVQLVSARRDAYVAGFALLAAMGKAEARDLGLDGGALYDPTAHYDKTKAWIWDWGSDGDPSVVASSTTGSPAQNADVTPGDDDVLNDGVDTGSATPDK